MDTSPNKLDLPQVFAKLRALGAEDIEIYAELRQDSQLDIWDRIHHTHQSTEKGLCVSCRKGQTWFQFSCDRWETDAVLKLLEGKRLNTTEALPTPPPAREKVTLTASTPATTPRGVTILNLARAAFAQGQGKVSQCDLAYEEQIKTFWVTHEETGWQTGENYKASLSANWTIERDDAPSKTFHWEHITLDPQQLLNGLKEEHWLLDAVKKSAQKQSAWPAPQGELPLYWSANALAKVCLPFLRAFEADLFLKQDSFLTEMEFPARWGFSLVDQISKDGELDAEGTPVTPVTLLKSGRPRALACDRKTAQEMQVNTTGHARRAHYRVRPTTGLRSVSAEFESRKEDLLEESSWGVWIEDVRILESSPKSGIVCLQVEKAYLLHEKVKGESIEPVIFEMPVQDFLATIQSTSTDKKTVGFEVFKEEQDYVTELHLPDAFTPHFPYPGTVPPDTYWE